MGESLQAVLALMMIIGILGSFLVFAMTVEGVKGRCYVLVHFQTRFDRPSRAMVVLQPSQGFFLVRPDLAGMTVAIPCPAGGYGVTSVPWPAARRFQGKGQALDVAADVRYPDQRGAMNRYRAGTQVKTPSFDTWRTIVTVAAAMGGSFLVLSVSKTTRVKLKLPVDVEEWVDDDLPITTKILWRLGDDPMPVTAKKAPGSTPIFESPARHRTRRGGDRSRTCKRIVRPTPSQIGALADGNRPDRPGAR